METRGLYRKGLGGCFGHPMVIDRPRTKRLLNVKRVCVWGGGGGKKGHNSVVTGHPEQFKHGPSIRDGFKKQDILSMPFFSPSRGVTSAFSSLFCSAPYSFTLYLLFSLSLSISLLIIKY